MPDALSEFHFLRPIWLVGLLGLPVLIWLLHRLVARASAWRDVLDNDLADSIFENPQYCFTELDSQLLAGSYLTARDEA